MLPTGGDIDDGMCSNRQPPRQPQCDERATQTEEENEWCGNKAGPLCPKRDRCNHSGVDQSEPPEHASVRLPLEVRLVGNCHFKLLSRCESARCRRATYRALSVSEGASQRTMSARNPPRIVVAYASTKRQFVPVSVLHSFSSRYLGTVFGGVSRGDLSKGLVREHLHARRVGIGDAGRSPFSLRHRLHGCAASRRRSVPPSPTSTTATQAPACPASPASCTFATNSRRRVRLPPWIRRGREPCIRPRCAATSPPAVRGSVPPRSVSASPASGTGIAGKAPASVPALARGGWCARTAAPGRR